MTPPADIGAHPVLIIGAGRSGTNMLRNTLTRLPGVSTWPCDEINYIWRHGNRDKDTDEFEPSDASRSVQNFIRGRFGAMAASSDFGDAPVAERVLLEKTCANSLRVGFVDTVLPEARYVYLVRDGRDVVASAAKRWTAPLDLAYLAAKARYVPLSDLPYYGSRYLLNRYAKLRDPEARLSVWGPRFDGWRDVASREDLETVCALQWARCIERSDAAFERILPERVCKLTYESLIADPAGEIARLVNFLGIEASDLAVEHACRDITDKSSYRGSSRISFDGELGELITPMLHRHGYR